MGQREGGADLLVEGVEGGGVDDAERVRLVAPVPGALPLHPVPVST